MDYNNKIESPIRSEKKRLILDSNVIEICTVKVNETGFLRKRITYAHYDGEDIHITVVNPNTGEKVSINPKN